MAWGDPVGARSTLTMQQVARLAAERDEARAEAQRLREAIADALADLTPGISPHGLLDAALRQGQSTGGPR